LDFNKDKTNLFFEKKEGSKVFDPAGGCKEKQIREEESGIWRADYHGKNSGNKRRS
jgi:hypothetical protein